MPTIPTYQRQIQPQSDLNFRAQAQDVSGAFGAGLGQTISRASEQISEQAKVQQAKLNQIAVANATTNTQKSLLPLQTDLLNRQGINALGSAETKDQPAKPSVTQEFTQQSQDVFKNTLDSLTNDTQRQQYTTWYNSIQPSWQNSVYNHEQEQVNVAHTNAIASQLDTSKESFASFMLQGKQKEADEVMRAGMSLAQQGGILTGQPLETQQENSKKFIYGAISSTADIMMANNRPEDAKKMVDWYGDKLPQSVKDTIMSKVNPALEQNETYNYVESLKSDPSMYNPDGTLNRSTMLESAKNKYMGRKKTITHPGTPGTDAMYNAAQIVSQRTGIDANFIYGQMYHESTGFTSQLARENFNFAGLTQTTPNGEDNKQPDGSNYYKQYGSVEEFANDYANFLNNYKNLNTAKTPDEYARLLHDQGYYKEDSTVKTPEQAIAEYTAGIQNGIGRIGEGAGGTPATTEEVLDPDLVGYRLAEQEINRAYNESVAARKQSLDNAFNSFDNYIVNNKPTTYAEIETAAKQFGFQGADLMSAISKGLQMRGIVKQEENEQSAAAYEEVLRKIYIGEITTKGEIDAYAGVIPYSRLIPLANSFKKEMKWASPENLMAFNGIMKEKKITGVEQGRIYEKMNQKAAELISKGLQVTVDDVQDFAIEQSQKVIIKRGTIWNDTTRRGNIPEGYQITPYGVLDTQGNNAEYVDGQWRSQVKEEDIAGGD